MPWIHLVKVFSVAGELSYRIQYHTGTFLFTFRPVAGVMSHLSNGETAVNNHLCTDRTPSPTRSAPLPFWTFFFDL